MYGTFSLIVLKLIYVELINYAYFMSVCICEIFLAVYAYLKVFIK